MKQMKLKALAAAVLALGASSAFAGTTTLTPATYTAGSEQNYVNTNIPDAVLYVAGSSALGGAVSTVLSADIFDTTTHPVIKIQDKSSDATQTAWTAGGSAAGGQPVSAWLGTGKTTLPAPYAGKLIYVVYNNWNGSAAGLSQVLYGSTAKAFIPEADVVVVGPRDSKGNIATKYAGAVANTCTLDAASTSAVPVVNCTTHAPIQADIGISDVNLTEVFALETPSGGTSPSTKAIDKVISELPKNFHVAPLAVQGFGVAVNANLYEALQHQNVADGLLPSSCEPAALLVGTATGTNTDAATAGKQVSGQIACMPTIRKADYSTLVTGADTSRNAADIVLGPNSSGDTTAVELARRDDYSGTQASSNIFFADNACGVTSVAGKAVVGVLGGAQGVINSTTASTSKAANLTVDANAVTGLVVNALNSTTGYAIGVVTLNKQQGTTDTWKFVKIDGVAPFVGTDVDAKSRTQFANGVYQFAETSYAAFPDKPLASKNVYGTATGIDGLSTDKTYTAANSLIPTVIAGLTNSSQHNLTGIGYTDGTIAGQQTHYHHAGDNNCAPVVHY